MCGFVGILRHDGGTAGELLHWTEPTRQAMIHLAERNEKIRFRLVGLELWARLTLRGDKPDVLLEEQLTAAGA